MDKVPKIISKNGHEYIFIQQNNENTFLYKDLMYGYKETFTKYDLGLVKPVTVRPRLRKDMNMKP